MSRRMRGSVPSNQFGAPVLATASPAFLLRRLEGVAADPWLSLVYSDDSCDCVSDNGAVEGGRLLFCVGVSSWSSSKMRSNPASEPGRGWVGRLLFGVACWLSAMLVGGDKYWEALRFLFDGRVDVAAIEEASLDDESQSVMPRVVEYILSHFQVETRRGCSVC